MAITKILARKGRLDVGIRYVLNGDKTQEQILTARLNCDPGHECRQMLETKRAVGKEGGVESAADLCGRCLDDVATDVLYMTGNDHALEAADPLELAEIKRRWEPYINQLPDYAYLCKDLLNGKM